MNTIMLSIIIPVYNVEKYLHECLQSVIKQSYENYEIILVDDGSTDASGRICDEYALSDCRIKVIHKVNQGLGYARNSGLAESCGVYVAFLDSDDILNIHTYRDTLGLAMMHNADAVYFACERFKASEVIKNDDVLKPDFLRVLEDRNHITEFMLDMVANPPHKARDRDVAVSSCMAIYKRDIIVNHGISFHSEKKLISEDTIFNLDFLNYSDLIVYSNAPYYKYRITPGSLSLSHHSTRIPRYFEYHDYLMNWVFDKKFNSEMKSRICRMTLGHIRSTCRMLASDKSKTISEVVELLNKQINHSALTNILNEYPWNKMIFKYYFVCLLLKYKMYYVLIVLLRIVF